MSAIAGLPGTVLGLTVLRGEPAPLVDLGLFLDGVGESSTRFITVRSGQNHVALAVDSVVGWIICPPAP